MYATDFNFDGQDLSSFNFVICQFDGSGSIEDIEAGVPLSYKKVSLNKGKWHPLIDIEYGDTIEIKFDICKDPCEFGEEDMIITDSEFLELSRWLLRDEFKQLFFYDDNLLMDRFYEGAFNLTKLCTNDTIIGLRLVFTTDKPYAYSSSVVETKTLSVGSATIINDESLYIGDIIPSLNITCNQAGDLLLTNTSNNTAMEIKNCSAGEVITVDAKTLIVASSLNSHKIHNDFSYTFLRLSNTKISNVNSITTTLPCEVTFSYRLIIRDTP